MSNEMIETTQPKSVMINPSYNSRKNRERIAREEEELEELMNGKPKDDAEDTPPVEEPIETEELAAEDEGDAKEPRSLPQKTIRNLLLKKKQPLRSVTVTYVDTKLRQRRTSRPVSLS